MTLLKVTFLSLIVNFFLLLEPSSAADLVTTASVVEDINLLLNAEGLKDQDIRIVSIDYDGQTLCETGEKTNVVNKYSVMFQFTKDQILFNKAGDVCRFDYRVGNCHGSKEALRRSAIRCGYKN